MLPPAHYSATGQTGGFGESGQQVHPWLTDWAR